MEQPAYHPSPVVSRAVKIFISVFFAGSFVRNNISVLPRVWAKRTPKRTSKRKLKKIYTLAEPCYYSLSHSSSFRNCRVALLLCLLAMELMVFFLFLLTGFVFNVTFRFYFVHYHSNIHACTNIERSFNCSCKPGYIGNGHNCSGWFLEFLSRFPLVLRLLVQYNRVNVQHCTFFKLK